VDLKRHRPIELLPDRSASTLAAWLQAHPRAQTIARDGSKEYARGIAEGAPEAVEVLDRWHLLKNLREALERMLDRNQKVLGGITLPFSERTDKTTGSLRTSDYTSPSRSPRERARSRAKREKRYARYEKVRELHSRGMSMRTIAKKLGISRYVDADTFPERRPHRRRPSMLDPFEPYLKRRWEEGCRNGMQLWRELRKSRAIPAPANAWHSGFNKGERRLRRRRRRSTSRAPTDRPADRVQPAARRRVNKYSCSCASQKISWTMNGKL
jgi:transposase